MLHTLKTSVLVFVLVIAGLTSCKKTDIPAPITNIDPTTEPSALSRAFKVKDGVNKDGNSPSQTTSSDLLITKYQPTALITADNYLFIPFIGQTSEAVSGIYFQVVGADNYWVVNTGLNSDKSQVLSIEVPANVLNGKFEILYGLKGVSGKIGKPVSLKATVKSPLDYCSNGSSSQLIEGNDGITSYSFVLGNKAGWVTVDYNTFTVPDRIDIRYNKQWIRSTGTLLTTTGPPTKPCSSVSSGDGFVGSTGSFNIFYDPAISKKIDVYVSGCLDGGTAWNFKIRECPKDMPVLGIHSRDGFSSSGSSLLGHSWISLTKDGTTTFYGLWPDSHPWVTNNGSASDVRTNVEKGIASTYNRYYPLENSQLTQFYYLLAQPRFWTYTYNCSSFAQEMIESLLGEHLNAGIPNRPSKLNESIAEKELLDPTSTYRAKNTGMDNSSCSFCY